MKVRNALPVIIFLLFGAPVWAQRLSEVPVKASRALQNQTSPSPGFSAPGASAEPQKIDPAKAADIRRLLELMGVKTIAQQMMDAMAKDLKPMMVNSLPPGDYRDKLVQLFFEEFQSKADAQQLIEMAIPSYDKYLADDEIKGLIA